MKKILALIAAFAALTSCTDKELAGPERSANSPILHASFEGEADATKTYVDNNFHLFWTADDRLSVFLGTTYNQQYRFMGETGDNAGDFEEVPASGLHSGSDVNAIYAVYPYQTTTKLSYDGKITADLPAVQQYAPGSFGLGANTMVAVTAGKSDTFLSFKNLCGYLVVKLYGSGTVKSVTIEGNDGEKLAGKATVTAAYGSAPSLTMADDATTSITIDCGEGVALGSTAETATEFWFCIPPVTFGQGFTVTVTDVNGDAFEKGVSSSKTIARNVINTLSALETSFASGYATPEMVDLGLSVMWASFNVGATKPEEVGGRFAWGEIEPKACFDWTNYIWCNGSEYSINKYCTSSSCGTVDGKTKLDDEDDAAIQILGDKWRMPTKAELDELVEKCTWTYEQINGTNGFKVTGPSGSSIFLPCNGQADESGLHWSSTAAVIWASETDGGSNAYTLAATDDHEPWTEICHHRHDGECIRAVYAESSSTTVPEMVDLGLPSGLKWASFNLGASKPEEYGDYYAWGETSTKDVYFESNYCFNYNVDKLPAENDAAVVKLGNGWRMPTMSEINELTTYCSWTYDYERNGYIVIGRNGNQIFLPHAGCAHDGMVERIGISGYFWSSTQYDSYDSYEIYTYYEDNQLECRAEPRWHGHSVRPVFDNGTEPQLVVPEMVDLGLPSGRKWASFNLGASKPEEYGGYYQWGGLQDVTNTSIYLDWDNCPYHTTGADEIIGWTKYIPWDKSSYWYGPGSPDDKTVLDLDNDIAHVILDDKWRMPTEGECRELIIYCYSNWATLNGVSGLTLTSKKNGNSIFLPAAGGRNGGSLYYEGSRGHYWSSSLCSDHPSEAWYLGIGNVAEDVFTNGGFRNTGLSVRPIYGDIVKATGITLDKTSLSLDKGEHVWLTASMIPANAQPDFVWSSSNSSVAFVSEFGSVTANGTGVAVITASLSGNSSIKATCTVTVKPDMVDLGLPSGLKWASCNLGASKPEEYGGYYQWGGLEDVTDTSIYLDWSNCPYHTGSSSSTGWTKYVPSGYSSYWSGDGSPDNKTVLDPEDDVAHVKLGGKWRMPTKAEFDELRNNCTSEWTTLNGVAGMKFTSKKSGYTDKWIFLPAAGYRSHGSLYNVGSKGDYWSSSLLTNGPTSAYYMYFNSSNFYTKYFYRYSGQSVRPVSE